VTTTEFGVQYEDTDGRTFTAGGYTEAGARRMVAAGANDYAPRPCRVMRRELGEWEAAEAGG
jgi:hypothetical protein